MQVDIIRWGHTRFGRSPLTLEAMITEVMRAALAHAETPLLMEGCRLTWQRDAEGYLTLSDLSKDVILSGGSNVYPREAEEVLLTHPAVREASVIGLADAEWGEIVVAVLVADPCEGLEAELDALCRARIARFKRPRTYLHLTELPKNNYGKILKTELRRRLA